MYIYSNVNENYVFEKKENYVFYNNDVCVFKKILFFILTIIFFIKEYKIL